MESYPSNFKHGGICVYYKNPLMQCLQECISFEIKIAFFLAFYCLPIQSQDEFETFAKNLELNLDKVSANNFFLTVVLGYFNAKLNVLYKNDKTSNEGFKIEGIASQIGLDQLIDECTRNTYSCIDLTYISQPSLAIEFGVHFSLRLLSSNNFWKIQS